jgi:SulP family sulfate permease
MLGAIESLLSAVVADGMAGTRHDSNQELVGQGVANIVAPLFGGFAATGAIARTATNIRNGGTSPLAGIVHALTLVMIILFLAPLAANIPLAALAAILFVVAWNMSEIPHFLQMVRARAPRRCGDPAGHLRADGVRGPGGGGQHRRHPGDAAFPAAHGGQRRSGNR